MSGCFGDNFYDRHFESQLYNYLNDIDNYGMCKCDIATDEDDQNVIHIDEVRVTKQELIDNDNFCTECGEPFNMEEFF